MELKVSQEIKEAIADDIIASRMGSFMINVVRGFATVFMVVGPLGYFAYGLVVSLGDYKIIAGCLIALMIGLILYMISGISLHKYTNPNLYERLDEKFELHDSSIRYSFRYKQNYDKYSRVAYNIVLKDLKSIKYNADEYKFVLSGKMCIGKTNDNIASRNIVWGPIADNEIVIYDYFDPGLCDVLTNRGVLTDDMMEGVQDE